MLKLRTLFVGLAAVAAAALMHPATGAAQNGGPEAVIKQYQSTLIEVMKRADALGYEGRARQLAPAIRKAYDLQFLARRAAGSHWRKFSDAEKKRYIDAFSRLSIATHAARFKGYGGESFKILGTDDPGRGYKLVKTQLVRPKGENVALNYLMAQRGGGWKIVDVFMKGTISEVATRRSEFATILAKGGADALIKAIEEQIQRQRSS